MKTKSIKNVLGWFLVSVGLLLTVSSPFCVYVWSPETVLSQDAVGVFICLIGIGILIRVAKRKETSN
jgi:hypothetical protein